MKAQDMPKLMNGQPSCLACAHAYSELYKLGFGDFAFTIRQLASILWSNTNISVQQRYFINDRLASLLRNISGEEEKCKYTVQEVMAHLDKEITAQKSII